MKSLEWWQMKNKLISAVTQFDTKASKRPGYNHHALGIYFQRVDDVCADIEAGAAPRAAIVAGFSGRLADFVLKSVGLEKTTDAEARGGYVYRPVAI